MRILLVAAMLALTGGAGVAQDFELEFTEQALNRLVGRLGDPGKGGIHQPDPLSRLGYTGCVSLATLDCPGGRATATPSAKTPPPLRLSRCQGPDGRGAIVPSVEPVSWQWWITQARFTIGAQGLQFAANVRYRVGTQWFSEAKTVPATLSLDVAGQRLRMDIWSFTVPVRYSAGGVADTITEVDVARHMSFRIPISAQAFQVYDLEGRARTLTSRTQGASVVYLPGKIQVKVDAAFN